MGILAELPALPLHEAGKYVAGAYVVAFVILLIYVAIMAIRLSHLERDLSELLALAREGEISEKTPPSSDEEMTRRESTLA